MNRPVVATRRLATTRCVADERMRLAQDVHDIVGHTLAAIKVQADVALHVVDKKPAQATTALSRAMIKLNARDRAQLVVFAFQAGLAG